MSLLTVDFGLSGRKNIVKDGARYPLVTGCDRWYLELIGIASPASVILVKEAQLLAYLGKQICISFVQPSSTILPQHFISAPNLTAFAPNVC